jgi:hypothetical protein
VPSSMSTTYPPSPYTGDSGDAPVPSDDRPEETSSSTRIDQQWYEVAQGESLEQGDLLPDVRAPRVLVDPSADGGFRILVGTGDYVVLSQTCDLENDKVREVLLASVLTYQDMAHEVGAAARSTAFREALIKGADFSYFLLHRFDGPPNLEWSVVNFHQLRLIDTQFCRNHAYSLGTRLRLVSPYKENLAQSFGRYMMRVALPQTAHSFKAVKYVPPSSSKPD